MAHIKRLLDLVACTTFFGGSSPKTGRAVTGQKEPGSSTHDAGSENAVMETKAADKKGGAPVAGVARIKAGKPEVPGSPKASGGPDAADKGDAEAAMMYPPPRLGQFYDFFSFSHLTPPIQCEIVVLSFKFL